jgi:hypothetical protein
MPFQQWQVFVRSGVKNELWAGEGKDLINPLTVPDIRDDDLVAIEQSRTGEFELHAVQVGFVVVQ